MTPDNLSQDDLGMGHFPARVMGRKPGSAGQPSVDQVSGELILRLVMLW
jgi:hypothetical protein